MTSKLMKYFGGKMVNVVMKSIRGSQVLSDGNVVEGSVIIGGYFLDEDDVYYYLGTDPKDIDEALLKRDLIRMYLETDEVLNIVDMDGNEVERH